MNILVADNNFLLVSSCYLKIKINQFHIGKKLKFAYEFDSILTE